MIGLAIRRHSAGAMSRLFASVRSCLPRKQTGTEPNEKWKEREREWEEGMGLKGVGERTGEGEIETDGGGGVREVQNCITRLRFYTIVYSYNLCWLSCIDTGGNISKRRVGRET